MVLPFDVFQGRWNLEGDERYTTHWCGSSLYFQTTSRSITLELGGLTVSRKNYHNLLWRFGSHSDARTALVKGKRTLVLTPSGTRTEADHDSEVLQDVTVMLCDWGAILQVLNIKTHDERPIFSPVQTGSVRPMLFIGASLVSGFSPPFSLVLPHGSFQAFGSVAVGTWRACGLDARLEMVAYPGLRLMSTDCGKGMEDVFWEGVDGVGGWGHRSKDVPHDIFVCLGSNDQGWGVDKDEFLQHYKAFLVRLRDSYPDNHKRIHVISPFGIFKDPSAPAYRYAVFEPDVQYMVEDLSQCWSNADQDGTKLYHVSTEGWLNKSLTCDGLHPTVEGHEVIAARLVDYLAARDSE